MKVRKGNGRLTAKELKQNCSYAKTLTPLKTSVFLLILAKNPLNAYTILAKFNLRLTQIKYYPYFDFVHV